MYEIYLASLEEGFREATFAFDGLPDDHVWRRPADGLLSVGELAGHIAYGEALRLAIDVTGADEGEARCRIVSPLIDGRFRYHLATMTARPSEEHLAMTAKQVGDELLRVHREAVAHFRALSPEPDTRIPGDPSGFTYGGFLQYAVFHVAYHVGQMYSVRHLLGDTPPDN